MPGDLVFTRRPYFCRQDAWCCDRFTGIINRLTGESNPIYKSRSSRFDSQMTELGIWQHGILQGRQSLLVLDIYSICYRYESLSSDKLQTWRKNLGKVITKKKGRSFDQAISVIAVSVKFSITYGSDLSISLCLSLYFALGDDYSRGLLPTVTLSSRGSSAYGFRINTLVKKLSSVSARSSFCYLFG